MGALARFEAFVESLIEGPFARLAGGAIPPVQLAKQIGREMERRQTVGPGKVYVPNRYSVRLHPDDHEPLASAAPALARELAAYAVNLANERGFTFLGPVTVQLEADPDVPRRQVNVSGEMAAGEVPATSGSPQPEVPAIERTQALNAARIKGAVIAAPVAELAIAGAGDDRRFLLERDIATIGRALDNDLVLEGPLVSRHHAEIRQQYGRYYLADLQSTNGTYLNGKRVVGSFLADGDRIRIGDVELRFHLRRGGER